MKETFGLISGLVVIISVIPYAIGTYRRTIKPNLASWSVWSVICLALLLTYRSSGAKANIWPAVFGFTNPTLIAILAIWRGERKWPNALEIVCVIIGLISIGMWCLVYDNQKWSSYALYLGIIADAVAAIPTIAFVWKSPGEDRPAAWLIFAVGYCLAIPAISEHTFANYILPVYMTVGPIVIAIPLVTYRVRLRIPLKEWI
jgi:hypothetical protein